MPNWCHNTLTVAGERGDVAAFAKAAQPTEASAREAWQSIRPAKGKRRPAFRRFYADYVACNPLSFASLVPEPSEAEYAEMDEALKERCWLCGGRGKRPATQEEADALGVGFTPNVVPLVPFSERPDCNGCAGSGRALPMGHGGSWYAWRLAHWGTKWDASFDGPGLALMRDEAADLEVCREAQGITRTPEIVFYKFDTAWAPPTPFVQRASERHRTLEFTLRYGEPGNNFAGALKAVAGEVTEEQELAVDEVLAPEEMWF
jgi:hypothetical protein